MTTARNWTAGLFIFSVLAAPSDAQVVVEHDSTATGEVGVEITDPTVDGINNGFVVTYEDAPGVSGVGLFAVKTGGLTVADSTGLNFSEVNATAFNVISAPTSLRDVELITPADAVSYLERLREIQMTRFRYAWEDEETLPHKHVGVSTLSLPGELTTVTTGPLDTGQPADLKGVRLADWLGVVTVALQEADRRIARLEAELSALRGGPVSPAVGAQP